MILMWLGSFFVALGAFVFLQKALNSFFAKFQNEVFKTTSNKLSTLALLRNSLTQVVLEASPTKSIYTALAGLSSHVIPERQALLQLCLSQVGAWWVVLVGFLILSFNGYFLLGISFIAVFTLLVGPKVRHVLMIFGLLGLVLVGSELALKNASVLQTYLGHSELAFFLADGRFPAVATLMFAALVLSLIIQVEYWAFLLALVLLATNNISMNGALAIVVGELLGRNLFLLIQGFRFDPRIKKYILQFTILSMIANIVSFFVAAELRAGLSLGFASDRMGFQEKLSVLTLLFVLILFVEFVVRMSWGHFAEKLNKTTSAGGYKLYPANWKNWGLLSDSLGPSMTDCLSKRLSEVKYHVQGVAHIEAGKIPESLIARLKTEELELGRILNDWRKV